MRSFFLSSLLFWNFAHSPLRAQNGPCSGEFTPEAINKFLDEYLKLVGETRRLLREEGLEVGLTTIMEVAIVRAHYVGMGEVGLDNVNLAGPGNFTQLHIYEKYRIMRETGLTTKQIKVLMQKSNIPY